MGAAAYTKGSNLFDNLFYSDKTPGIVMLFVFLYSLFVVMPVVVK
jgi:hypothetical protein